MIRTLVTVLGGLLVIALILVIMWLVNRRGPYELVGFAARRMARLLKSVQPYCSEKIIAAVMCNHDGRSPAVSIPSTVKQAANEMGLGLADDPLPGPVVLAASDEWIYAFEYSPRLIGVKIERELIRWPRDEAEVFVGHKYSVAYVVLGTRSSRSRVFEIGALHTGAARLFNAFVKALKEEDKAAA